LREQSAVQAEGGKAQWKMKNEKWRRGKGRRKAKSEKRKAKSEKLNQGAETRPWEGRVVATVGGPEGRALREQASTNETLGRSSCSHRRWTRRASLANIECRDARWSLRTKPPGGGAEKPSKGGIPKGRHCFAGAKCRSSSLKDEGLGRGRGKGKRHQCIGRCWGKGKCRQSRRPRKPETWTKLGQANQTRAGMRRQSWSPKIPK